MARFLIVDDSKLVRAMLKDMLLAAGHEVVAEAENGSEGKEMYFQHKPDIVILDNLMPVEGGLDCLKNILAQDPEAKIIIVSSIGKENMIDEELRIGARAYITKPVDREAFLSAVASVLEV